MIRSSPPARASLRTRALVAVTCTTLALFAASESMAKLVRCLPDPKCKTIKACCTFPHDSLYRFSVASLEIEADFFDNQKNRDRAKKNAEASKGKTTESQAMNDLLDKWIAGAAMKQALRRAGLKNGVPTSEALSMPNVDYRTTGLCNVIPTQGGKDLPKTKSPLGDLDSIVDGQDSPSSLTPDQQDDLKNHPIYKQDTCSEFVKAGAEHEAVHQAACEAYARGDIKKDRDSLEQHSNEERDAYADQAETLRIWRDGAKKSCKKMIDNEKLARASKAVSAFKAANGARGGAL